jgi:hypothetical protein
METLSLMGSQSRGLRCLKGCLLLLISVSELLTFGGYLVQ